MAEDQKENSQEITQEETLSILDKKRKELLDEIDELMGKIGEDFGPVFQEELQQRLEFVIENFNEEVQSLFSNSFEKWKITDIQIRDLMEDSIKMPKSQSKKIKSNDSSIPNFIKDVEFGPVRSK